MVRYSMKYSELEFGLKHKRYCDSHGINPNEANLEEINKAMYEELCEKRKKRYQENRDAIQEIIRKYKGEKREEILQHRKEYAKQKCVCECGWIICRNNLSTHMKTDKHRQAMADNLNYEILTRE